MLNVMVLRRKGVGHALSRPDVFAERVGQLSVLCFVKFFCEALSLQASKAISVLRGDKRHESTSRPHRG